VANRTRKKQSHSDRHQGYKDISPNAEVHVWVKDRKCVHSTRVASKEYVDYDYLNSLSKEEKAFLKKFTEEYYFDQFSKDTKHLHDKEQIKELRQENELRRRGYLSADAQPLEYIENKKRLSPEDDIIEYIDYLKTKS